MGTDPLGEIPTALKGLVRDVKLRDGSSVRLEMWSLTKFIDLADCIQNPKEWGRIAIESVREDDRERVKTLCAGDQLTIAVAAKEMNLSGDELKNAGSLLAAGQSYREAMPEKKSP